MLFIDKIYCIIIKILIVKQKGKINECRKNIYFAGSDITGIRKT